MVKKAVKKVLKKVDKKNRVINKVADVRSVRKEQRRDKERTQRNHKVLARSKELLDNAGDCRTVEVLERRDCCGCHSCESVCPFGAITMEPDEEGFLYPVINKEKCTNCGLCQKSCPALQLQYNNDKNPDCYAVMASDEIRDVSSSGGMFSLVALPVLEEGGVVCGAAYGEDFRVQHIMIDNKEDMYKLRGSKYVQSANDLIYKEIKAQLATGRKVLYSGCPCQVSGLYAYLKEDPENLITVDLICHGVPSPKTFKKYIEQCYADKEIESISFRDKKVYGWSTEMNVYFKDGTEHHERCSKDPYYRAFLPCLGMRPCCTVCKYTTLPRQADISVGDFWGIGNYRPDLRDTKGTSLVLVNSEKGRKIFEQVKGDMKKVDAMPITTARPRNYTIDHPFRAHPQRKRFFALLKQHPFEKAVQYALTMHYDIGVIGLWYGFNYGSMLTYYALNRALENMGFSVLMIDNPLPANEEARKQKTHPYAFARQYYRISAHRSIAQLKELNSVCDSFIVGSDQLWNYNLSKSYGQTYFLHFADDAHKKISYASSFGRNEYSGPEGARVQTAQNLQRFDAVSVREEGAADLCRNIFGVEAATVMDPVFLCEQSDYDVLLKDSGLDIEEDYILAYILNATPEKGKMLQQIAEQTGRKVYLILDLSPLRRADNERGISLEDGWNVELLQNIEVREWLYYMKHAQGIVTDSFHGTCFSIIFHRKFISMLNEGRGGDRFKEILGKTGLMNHLFDSEEAVLQSKELFEEIDYTSVDEQIQELAVQSRKWLMEALTSPKTTKGFASYSLLSQADTREK